MEIKKVAFLGLGVMGFPMAGHLSKAGLSVNVYNRTESKADEWINKYDGAKYMSPKEAALNSDIVFTCVGNDDDLRSVILGPEGAFSGMNKGSILVDHTTASANVAREIYKDAAGLGIGFLDAPVSGGQAGAENGQLSVMVGGDDETFESVKNIINIYSKIVQLMGPIGSGQLTKMVYQICIAGLLQGLSEGVNLDVNQVINVISKGAAGSWQMENRANTMAKGEFDFGFAVKWMLKDLNICLKEAKTNGSLLPVTALIEQFYSQISTKKGGDRWDTSSLIDLIKKY